MNRPDINKQDEIIDAICQLEVLAGHSRTLGEDGKPERYIENLADYISPTRIREFVESQLIDVSD